MRESQPQIKFADEFVVVELVGGAAFEGDLAVHDDVAAIGDVDGLNEVLLGHQHGQLVTVLQLLDLLDRALDEDRARPTDGSSISRILGADISARARASICRSPPLSSPANWRRRSRSTGKVS